MPDRVAAPHTNPVVSAEYVRSRLAGAPHQDTFAAEQAGTGVQRDVPTVSCELAVPATPVRRSPLDAFHGPRGTLRRGVGAALGVLAIALITGLVVGLIERPAGPGLATLGIALVAFMAVTIVLGAVRNDSRGLPGPRGPLVAGAAVTLVLASAVVFAVSIPAPRTAIVGVILAACATAIAYGAGEKLFRPRAVVISPSRTGGSLGAPSAEAVVGVSDPEAAEPEDLLSATVDAVDAVGADVVHIAGPIPEEAITHISWGLRSRRIPIQLDLLQGTVGSHRVHASTGIGSPAITVEAPARPWAVCAAKRAMDVLGSGAIILLTSPVLVATAIAVKATDGGPIIYRQERVGRNGELFEILKFRTMAVDADARLAELLREQQTEGKPLFKVQNDPRLTRIGGFLRRYSIDELPQLFNVLTGDMSLVGPRPQRDAEVALYTGTASHRLGVRPGMTGIWQVSGRSNLSWEEARRLDVHYAHNWSLSMDIAILLRTFRAVVGKDGAY
ncbi:sugar transferase [Brachybacterium huguangmaarense]